MNCRYFQKFLSTSLIVLLCTNCSTIQHFQQQAQYSAIQAVISPSSLNKVNEFTSRTPFHKTYEFEFSTPEDKAYSLVFYLSENNFAKSRLKHRNVNELHRHAVRIDQNKDILTTLNKNLPESESIAWFQVTKQISKEDAQDGYQVMQEFIRLKIRDI